ncbi:MAG: V-type ATPase 116kDa subunit family protein [Actinomycetota bacterium]|nr:V-type ATPase 116kDa subunit family protein [Actinomycetota bacterium]
MIERMAKVEILGLKDVSLEAIDLIHELGTLHIEDLSEKITQWETHHVSKMEMDSRASENQARLKQLRDKVAEVLRELKGDIDQIPKEEIEREYELLWSDNIQVMTSSIERLLSEVERSTREPVERRDDLMVELSRLEKYAPIIAKVQPLVQRAAQMEDTASIALIIERKYKAILNYLNEEISKITKGECEIISADVDEESTAALVVFGRHYLKAVHEFLAVQDVNQVRLPADIARVPIDEAVTRTRARIAEIPKELEEIEAKLSDLTQRYTTKLVAARNAIHDRLETMETLPKFGQTDQVFVISGWLPEEEVKPMEEALLQKFGNKVVMTVTDIREEREEEETPVMLRNNPYVRHFELIYMLSKYPKYGTIDPTFIFAIFFPIFFGLMLGDIGYGIIVTILGLFVYKKWKDKPWANMGGYILAVSGGWTIFFGVIYLEFFGNILLKALGRVYEVNGVEKIKYFLGTEKSILKYPIDRLEAFALMFAISLVLGLVHMGIGLVIGIINGIREGNKKHAMEKGGLLMILMGALMVVAEFGLSWWPMFLTIVGGILFVAGLVMAALGGGAGGLVEGFIAWGNLFSYVRLYAIGLASVIMAVVANQLASDMGKSGIAGLIVGILIFILLHALNIVIGMFSPSIHSLRLHLVESFGKFFEPAKFEYKPFRKTGGESK